MNDREKWRERVRDIRAGGMTSIYLSIYLSMCVCVCVCDANGRKLNGQLACNHKFISTSQCFASPDAVHIFTEKLNIVIYVNK